MFFRALLVSVVLAVFPFCVRAHQIAENPNVIWAGLYINGSYYDIYYGDINGYVTLINGINEAQFDACIPQVDSYYTCSKMIISNPHPATGNLYWYNGVPGQISFDGEITIQSRYGTEHGPELDIQNYQTQDAGLMTAYWSCSDGSNITQSPLQGNFSNQSLYCVDSNAAASVMATPPPICLSGDQSGKYTKHPILPATGQKFLLENDFLDVNAHPLHITRRYLAGC